MATKRTDRPSDTEWMHLDPDLRIAAAAAVLWEIRDILDDIAGSLRQLAER